MTMTLESSKHILLLGADCLVPSVVAITDFMIIKMIPYTVFPMLKLGPLHFNMYGVMFALGALIVIFLAAREAERRGIDKKSIENLSFYMLLGVIFGARLFFVLFYWPKGEPLTFFNAIAIWNGGLSWFGGFVGAVIFLYLYTMKNKLNFLKYADIFTLPLVIGHILGRIGGYLTGQHPGKPTDLPWAIYLNGVLRHPVVLYEILGLTLILLIVWRLKKTKYFEGFLFSSYIVLYSIQRMILDFFRIESTDPRYLGLTPSQYIVIALFVLSGYFIVYKFRKKGVELG